MLRLNRMARRNRKSCRRNRNRNRKQNGGACALSGAPYGADLMADSRAQSLAQGNQFATITRPYHGGSRTRRRNRRVMYGGMAPLSIFGSEGTGVDRASAHLTGQDNALAEAAGYSRTHPDLPDAMGAQVLDAVNKGMAQVGGSARRANRRRNRKSRKGNRKSRKDRKNRKNRNSRRNRRMNGGRRSCGMMRGGAALLEGAPYSQGSSDMLLADDAALQAQAAKMESPAWTGVARGTYLG